MKEDKFILLKRDFGKYFLFEIHRGSISQTINLIFSTTDQRLAEGIVDGWNTLHMKQKEKREYMKQKES